LLAKGDAAVALRRMGAAARVGAACLGVALIASSLDPPTVLVLIGVGLVLSGGAIWRWRGPRALLVRVLASLTVVGLVRWAGGPAAAGLATGLVALGAAVRVRPFDVVSGFAAFGAAVALLGRADLPLILSFWVLGLGVTLVAPLRAWLRRRVAAAEPAVPEEAHRAPVGQADLTLMRVPACESASNRRRGRSLANSIHGRCP